MTDREEARPPTRFGFVAVDRERLVVARSEEHTSELQSQSNLVCRLLLEKKKKNLHIQTDQLQKEPTMHYQHTNHLAAVLGVQHGLICLGLRLSDIHRNTRRRSHRTPRP